MKDERWEMEEDELLEMPWFAVPSSLAILPISAVWWERDDNRRSAEYCWETASAR